MQGGKRGAAVGKKTEQIWRVGEINVARIDDIDFPIPGNDDAIRSVTLLTRVIADAVAEGLIARAGRAAAVEGDAVEIIVEEPLAEWEQELLAGGATPEATVTTTVETEG